MATRSAGRAGVVTPRPMTRLMSPRSTAHRATSDKPSRRSMTAWRGFPASTEAASTHVAHTAASCSSILLASSDSSRSTPSSSSPRLDLQADTGNIGPLAPDLKPVAPGTEP